MSSEVKYRLLDGVDKQYGIILRIPFGRLAWLTVSLPFGGFIICVLWSLFYSFEQSTATHCGVANYLPSVSAAIGTLTPQRYIWRVAIAIHAAPRLLVAAMYYHYYESCLYAWSHFLARIACYLNVVENLSLIGLTYIASSENYNAHEKCFITFMVCSELYMILSCYLLQTCRSIPENNVESRSLRFKWKLLATNIGAFALAGYFFIRHNRYCEPGVYTLFSLCEYIVVLSNMAFHMTASWDFHDRDLLVGPSGLKFS